jgi:hypothetical protein
MGIRAMKDLALLKVVLLVSGISAIGIACAILFAPEVFYATYGIELGSDANLVNELKAPSGALLAAGVLMLAGIFNSELAFVSTATAAAVYLSYGLARLSSIAIDGFPNGALITAASFELIIGTACALALFHFRNTEDSDLKQRR